MDTSFSGKVFCFDIIHDNLCAKFKQLFLNFFIIFEYLSKLQTK